MRYYLLICLLTFISCSNDKTTGVKSLSRRSVISELEIEDEKVKEFVKSTDENTDLIKIPEDIMSNEIKLSKLMSDISFIPLETNEESMIGKIRNILYDDGYFFIHDKRNKKLLRFNNEGKFINRIGDIGRGPKELIEITDVSIDIRNKLVSILDTKLMKIIRYTYAGVYVDSKPMYYLYHSHQYCDDGDIVFRVIPFVKNKKIPSIASYGLILSDSLSTPLNVGFKFPNDPLVYGGLYSLTKFNNNIYYHQSFSNEIWEVKKEQLKCIVRFDEENNPIQNDLWKKEITYNEVEKSLTDTFFSGKYIASDSLLFFKFYHGDTKKVSRMFFDRKTKKSIYGGKIKPNDDKPLELMYMDPVTLISTGHFVAINSPIRLLQIKDNILKNKEMKRAINQVDFEKLKKIKQTDNPVLTLFKVKKF